MYTVVAFRTINHRPKTYPRLDMMKALEIYNGLKVDHDLVVIKKRGQVIVRNRQVLPPAKRLHLKGEVPQAKSLRVQREGWDGYDTPDGRYRVHF